MSRQTFLTDALLFICCASLLALLTLAWHPKFGTVTYRFSDLRPYTTHLPILISSRSQEDMIVHVPMYLHWFHSTMFTIKPDDCIGELRVNGRAISRGRFCDYGQGKNIELASHLKRGWNNIDLVVKDQGGKVGISIQPARMDIGFLLLIALTVSLCLWLLFVSRDYVPWVQARFSLVSIVVFGALLRWLYVLATPLRERSYDIDGHLQYLQYVLSHWKLPLASAGWELHQPPLYYFAGAGFLDMLKNWGYSFEEGIGLWQWSSFLCSIGALIAGIWCLCELLPRKEHKRWVLFGAFFLSVYPGVLMFSSRITNDAFAHMFIFFSAALLFRWWRKHSMASWYGFLCIATVAILTKISALPLLLTGFILLLFRKQPLKHLFIQALAATALVGLLFGWYPALRFDEPSTRSTLSLGNVSMGTNLKLERNLGSYLTFNPTKIVQIPFNNPWKDDHRRQYLPEYFFKSSLFGEFQFATLIPLARALIISLLFLLPFCILGFLAELRTRAYESAPVLILTLFFGLAAVFYPTIFPYASNQDFRFSSFILLLATYFMLRGIYVLPKRLRILGIVPMLSFSILAALFILKLYEGGIPVI